MQTLSPSDFTFLTEFSHPLCISIYIPTDPTHPDPRLNKTTFKNAVNKVIKQLQDLKQKPDTYTGLDQACEALLADEVFWKEQGKSFVLFAAGELVKTFNLPLEVPALTMISDHFYIVPLVSLSTGRSHFFVLELDKEHTKMWRGNDNALEVVKVPNLPKSIAEVTGIEVNERQLQFHTGTDSPTGGGRPAVFHGTSSWKDDKDRYLEKFIQAVDHAVCEYFKQTNERLFISGTEELTVMFRKLSRYKHSDPITLRKVDDPTHRIDQLHEQALAIMNTDTEQARATAVVSFEEEPRPERKITILPEVIRQAIQGKIGELLVADDVREWGTIAPETLTVIMEESQQPLSSELVNVATRLTLLNSGKVTVLPSEQMPTATPVAAVLRY